MLYKRLWDIFSDRFGTTIFHPQYFTKKYAWEAVEIAKKGGTIVISTVQMYPIHDDPYDYLRYTKYGLRELCERSGLKVVDIKSNGAFWSFLATSINVYLFQGLLFLMKKRSQKIIGI